LLQEALLLKVVQHISSSDIAANLGLVLQPQNIKARGVTNSRKGEVL